MSRYNVNNVVIRIFLIVFALLFVMIFLFTLIGFLRRTNSTTIEVWINLFLGPLVSALFFTFLLRSIAIDGNTLTYRGGFSKTEIVSKEIVNYALTERLGLRGFLFHIRLESGKNLRFYVTSTSCKVFLKDWLENAVLSKNSSEEVTPE